jgi:hypothetical protein
MPVIRRCYKEDCGARMRPSQTVYGSTVKLRIYHCTSCGAAFPWLDNPKLDGTVNQAHRTQDGNFCCVSALSDPDCRVFPRQEPPDTRRRRRTIPPKG